MLATIFSKFGCWVTDDLLPWCIPILSCTNVLSPTTWRGQFGISFRVIYSPVIKHSNSQFLESMEFKNKLNRLFPEGSCSFLNAGTPQPMEKSVDLLPSHVWTWTLQIRQSSEPEMLPLTIYVTPSEPFKLSRSTEWSMLLSFTSFLGTNNSAYQLILIHEFQLILKLQDGAPQF